MDPSSDYLTTEWTPEGQLEEKEEDYLLPINTYAAPAYGLYELPSTSSDHGESENSATVYAEIDDNPAYTRLEPTSRYRQGTEDLGLTPRDASIPLPPVPTHVMAAEILNLAIVTTPIVNIVNVATSPQEVGPRHRHGRNLTSTVKYSVLAVVGSLLLVGGALATWYLTRPGR